MGSCLTVVLDAQSEIGIMSDCIGLVLLLQIKDIMQFVFTPTVKRFTIAVKGDKSSMQGIQRRFATYYAIPFWIPLLAAFQLWVVCLIFRRADVKVTVGGVSLA